ncbi:hypothetical protein Jiend_46090 [Micromonospora endophytica]|uniref:hypothetical protein n=1 Tax=Micromonospora endophytica TaxID=515350 RepID=UPI001C322F7C|nr:hypothetical protein Jiend_46090 [Micromonospora endophytica]
MSPDTPAVEPPPPASPADPPPAAAAPRVARTVAVTLLVLTLLGAPLGLLWATLAPATPVVKTPDGAVYGQPQPEQPVAADGWFSLLGLGFGVLAALAVWFVLSRRRGRSVWSLWWPAPSPPRWWPGRSGVGSGWAPSSGPWRPPRTGPPSPNRPTCGPAG